MSIICSLIIPTYKPNLEYLNRVIKNIYNQTYPYQKWELIIVDNSGDDSLNIDTLNIPSQLNCRLVTEKKVGLSYARLKGIEDSSGNFLILVDDDNVLDINYIKNVINIFENNKNLGAIGGKSIPEFEIEPKEWVKTFYKSLALRDLGDINIISDYNIKKKSLEAYPDYAPIGAGMSLRKEAIENYINNFSNNSLTDRKGESLTSGGDNDLVLSIIFSGWQVGYFPDLSLIHIIPQNRTTKEYLAKLNRHSSNSWIQVLLKYNICPWEKINRWTVLPRKIKAFITYKPWLNETNYIKCQGAFGVFEGLSEN